MTHAPLIPELELVWRCESLIGEYTATRVQMIADRPGDPRGAGVRRLGRGVATRCQAFGEHMFNRAFGFDDEALDAAREVIDWYAEWDVAAAFEIAPGPRTEALMALLSASGFRQTGFHATFAGRAEVSPEPVADVEVGRMSSSEDLAAFSRVYHAGRNITGYRAPKRPWVTAPGWSLYLGLYDGTPAGAAILFMSGGLGYLADAAVDPDFRRRGVHRALIDGRRRAAAANGAEVVCSAADYLSGSSRNLIRRGLGLLHTRAIWTRRPHASSEN